MAAKKKSAKKTSSRRSTGRDTSSRRGRDNEYEDKKEDRDDYRRDSRESRSDRDSDNDRGGRSSSRDRGGRDTRGGRGGGNSDFVRVGQFFELDNGTMIASCTDNYYDKFLTILDKIEDQKAPGIAFFAKDFGGDLVLSCAPAKERKQSSRGGGGRSFRGRRD